MADNGSPASVSEPKNADQLEKSVEESRTSALRVIDERIALYDPKSVDQKASLTTPLVSQHTRHGGSHRALDVVELLEQILSHASPRTHYAAWNVSRHWREVVVHTLDTQYRVPYPCAAVEHGDAIPPSLKWLPPSNDEVTELQDTIDMTSSGTHDRRLFDPFLTAQFTQANTLPQPLLNALHTRFLVDFRMRSFKDFYYPEDCPRLLDLSQVEVNPYFVDLFGDCFQSTQGNYTITVKPRIKDYFQDISSAKGPYREQLIHSMFLTRPPCKVLRIYAIGKSHEDLQVVGTVNRTDGIHIGDLLLLLQKRLSTAIEVWRNRSQSLREDIAGHTTLRGIHKAWNCPGFPKLAIFLESTTEHGPPMAQRLSYINQRNHYMHKTEWHEDHTKPTRIFAGNPELRDPELERPLDPSLRSRLTSSRRP